MNNVWVTADTHFGHANIIRYCNRPFKVLDEHGQVRLDQDGREMVDVAKHDQVLIDNINSLVKPDDVLYHLGDFAFTRRHSEKEQIQAYRDRIACRNVYLIAGNHDPHNKLDQPQPWLRDIFSGVYVRICMKVMISGQQQYVTMDHYASRVWNQSHRGSWQLHGHSHGTLQEDDSSRSCDVGVDCNDLKPVSIDQLAEVMNNKLFTAFYTRRIDGPFVFSKPKN